MLFNQLRILYTTDYTCKPKFSMSVKRYPSTIIAIGKYKLINERSESRR